MSGDITRIAQTPQPLPLAQTTRQKEGGVEGAIPNPIKQQLAAEGTFRDRSKMQDDRSASKERPQLEKKPALQTQVSDVSGTLVIQERNELTGEIAFQFPSQAVVQGYASQSKIPELTALEGNSGEASKLVDVKG